MNAARAKATVELNLSGDGQGILDLAEDWRLRRGLPDPETLADSFPESLRRVCVRGKGLEAWDSGLTAFLLALQERLERRGVELDLSEAPEGAARILALARGAAPEEEAPSSAARASLPALLGVKVIRAAEAAVDVAAFLGECSLALGRWATGRSRSRATDFFLIMQRSGAEALPIVLLINGLVGMILAFVGAVQLRQFGASIYVADLVALAMLREMGALMTGIILSGRTGAAYAAQLGTMQVNQEIDAFRALGVPPVEFLVLPRIVSMTLMMPLLVAFADAVGVLGGLAVSSLMLDLSSAAYWNETLAAASLTHLNIGLVKALVFGALIAFWGCYHGIRSGRSAESVGIAATRAVVASITAIIVADAIFAVALTELGL